MCFTKSRPLSRILRRGKNPEKQRKSETECQERTGTMDAMGSRQQDEKRERGRHPADVGAVTGDARAVLEEVDEEAEKEKEWEEEEEVETQPALQTNKDSNLVDLGPALKPSLRHTGKLRISRPTNEMAVELPALVVRFLDEETESLDHDEEEVQTVQLPEVVDVDTVVPSQGEEALGAPEKRNGKVVPTQTLQEQVITENGTVGRIAMMQKDTNVTTQTPPILPPRDTEEIPSVSGVHEHQEEPTITPVKLSPENIVEAASEQPSTTPEPAQAATSPLLIIPGSWLW